MSSTEPTLAELRVIAQRNLADQIARARQIMGDPMKGVMGTVENGILRLK